MGIAAPSGALIAPRQLPDGSVEWIEQGSVDKIVEALRQYDPLVTLVRNVPDGRWEIWRQCEDGEPRRCGYYAADRIPSAEVLLRQLLAYDTRRGFNPIEATDAAEKQLAHDQDAAATAVLEDVADKFHHALVHDLDVPAARPMPLGGR